MRSAVPAKRQAAGVPSAWSQPFQPTHARPRRWCDAGPPGRQSVTAAQKAGAEGRTRDSIRGSGSVRIRTRDRCRSEHVERAPQRGAGHAIVPDRPPGTAAHPAQWRCRAPSGSAMTASLPATREAAGVPSAWSQPLQSTHARPRRWCDAGPPGRQSVTAAQKAGAEGRTRDSIRGSGSVRIRTRDRCRSEHVERAPQRGAGHAIVPDRPPGTAAHPAQWRCRAPSGSAMTASLPARREAAGVPSAWSQPLQSTHARPRRWCDAGPPGRQSVTAAQKAGAKKPWPSPGRAGSSDPDTPAASVRHAGWKPVPTDAKLLEHVESGATTGCRARYCAGSTPRHCGASRTMALPGSLGERDDGISSGDEEGRRRTIGVVAALPTNPRATTPMVRRWAAGTPMRHGGPEGRC